MDNKRPLVRLVEPGEGPLEHWREAGREAAGKKGRRSAKSRSREKHDLKPLMKVLKAIHSAANPDSMAPQDLARQRRGHKLLGRLITPMIGMEWQSFERDGVPMAWTRPERLQDRRRAILYCHGGGYTSGDLDYSRILSAKFAQEGACPVLSFAYRLAPEHPYPAALEDGMRAWDYLMYQGYGARDVVIAGDSAGGNMALCLTLRLRSQGRLLPRGLVLFSPWTDMTASGRSYEEKREVDPMLTDNYIQAVRRAYAGEGADLTDPDLSPLFADLAGLPPTLIQVGSSEILLSDSVRLRDRLVMAGVPCRLEVWKDMWHVFQMFPMGKSAQAMSSVGRFLRETL